MPRRQQPEAALQRTICEHLEARAAPGLVWWHCPNGGARSKTEAAIMAGLGVKRGVADLHFLKDGQFYVLELKASGKTPNEEQYDFLVDIARAGGWSHWASSLDVALELLEGWGLIRGKTV